MNINTKTKGFSIIEVVLVLAIAGLIFLMVFVALPALQRGQANTARKNDANAIASAIGTYRSNNRGALPTTYAHVQGNVDSLSQLIWDTSTTNLPAGAYTMPAADTRGNLDKVFVRRAARCGNNGAAVAGTSRQAVVMTVVQNSANSFTPICVDA